MSQIIIPSKKGKNGIDVGVANEQDRLRLYGGQRKVRLVDDHANAITWKCNNTDE
jgi:hypothetical protein